MTMDQSILCLLTHLRLDAGSPAPEEKLLNFHHAGQQTGRLQLTAESRFDERAEGTYHRYRTDHK